MEVGGVISNPVPIGYQGLEFQAYGVNNVSLALNGLRAHSEPNLISTGSVSETTTGQAMIAVNFSGSNTTSFDIESMYVGCRLGADTDEAALPQACIISFAGYRGKLKISHALTSQPDPSSPYCD